MYNLSVQYSSSYLLVVVSGVATAADFCASTVFLADLAQRMKYRRVLLDMLAADMKLQAQADQLAVLEHLKQWAPAIDRLAYVTQPGVGWGVLDAMCRARGIASQQFEALAAAEGWLVAPLKRPA